MKIRKADRPDSTTAASGARQEKPVTLGAVKPRGDSYQINPFAKIAGTSVSGADVVALTQKEVAGIVSTFAGMSPAVIKRIREHEKQGREAMSKNPTLRKQIEKMGAFSPDVSALIAYFASKEIERKKS